MNRRVSKLAAAGMWIAMASAPASLPAKGRRPCEEPYEVALASVLAGSGASQVRDVFIDPHGNVYVTGGTDSADFVRTLGPRHKGSYDVFVVKLDSEGELLWSRLIGGPNYDRAYAIEVDEQGFVYVGGRAGDGYPTTEGALQADFAGDSDPNRLYGPQDAFATKLSPDGREIIWSTYFGADDRGFFRDIDIDASGNLYGAYTAAAEPNPHVTAGSFQDVVPGPRFGVVAKINSDGGSVAWASYIGGAGDGYAFGTPSIRVDADGSVVVVSHAASPGMPTTPGTYDRRKDGKSDMHIARFSADGSDLLFGTYLGGSDIEFGDTHNLALGPGGTIVVAATTKSRDFPIVPGAFQEDYGGSGGGYNQQGDGFVAILSRDGRRLVASTFFGGSSGEGLEGVALDAQGNVYVSGGTYSRDLPETRGPALARAKRPQAYVAKFAPDLKRLLFGSYHGGNDWDLALAVAVGSDGAFSAAGETKSRDFPLSGPAPPAKHGSKNGTVLLFEPVSCVASKE